jgi:pyruvate dehydrogenase E2 component (dihydrolipoamide acetyltransferase)
VANVIKVPLPDIGDFKGVEVIEITVSPGDRVEAEDSLITLESDKASMEVPAPQAGVIGEVLVKVGDAISEGDVILTITVEEGAASPAGDDADAAEAAAAAASEPEPEVQAPADPAVAAAPAASTPATADVTADTDQPAMIPKEIEPIRRPPASPAPAPIDEQAFQRAHASPSVRRYARELGVDLGQVSGSGPKQRIRREDVQAHVKGRMAEPPATAGAGGGMPAFDLPDMDFSAFGEVEEQALSRIKRLTGVNLQRNAMLIPHVTQFDEADVTELEAFRKSLAGEAEKRGTKLTFMAFLIKAVVYALKEFPEFNASLSLDGERLILKKYFHIGFAADTPQGLVVPVLRDADQKGLFEIAAEVRELSIKARERKLRPADMQGGCFSISSLGGIGGTAFTPIVNWPEVAILGVSRTAMKPVYRDGEFEPRLMLPLSLSYDHRVIDGANGVRFTTFLGTVLTDIRRVLL